MKTERAEKTARLPEFLPKRTLLEELAEIDAAYAEGDATPEQESRGHEIVTLANAAPELLTALKLCERALQERDTEAEEFAAKNAAAIIHKATGGARTDETPKTTITVMIEGGLVQAVTGIPAGFEVHIEDCDEGDTSHPSWDAEKACFVTVYEGDGMSKLRHTDGSVRSDGLNIIAHEAEIGVAKVYGNIGQPREGDARLLTAAYNAFDSAAKNLGVNAIELAERMQDGELAELINALSPLVDAVFNDNGDITMNFAQITSADGLRARAILAKLKGGAS